MNHPIADNSSHACGLAELASAKRTARPHAPATEGDAVKLSSESSPDAAQAVLPPWQFRLRTMLVVVAALSGLFAVMHFIGAVWSAILAWFLVLAMAHVTANFWGTRVAPEASQQRVDEPLLVHAVSAADRKAMTGAVRLRESLRPGWPMLAATIFGAILGGALGSIALVLLSLKQAGYMGVIVGSVSAAAVGGFLGFLTSSFAEIALRAWKEALSGAADDGR